MKVIYRVNDDVTIEHEAADFKVAFGFLSYMQGLFTPTTKTCGKCGKHDIRCQKRRTKEGHVYYSFVCNDCGAEFKLSEQKPENGGQLYHKEAAWVDKYVKPADGTPAPQTNGQKRELATAGIDEGF